MNGAVSIESRNTLAAEWQDYLQGEWGQGELRVPGSGLAREGLDSSPPYPNPEPGTRNSEPILTSEALRQRFGFGSITETRAALKRLKLPLVEDGRRFWTTEAAILRWFLDQLEPEPRPTQFDPLEQAALALADARELKLLERGVILLATKLPVNWRKEA